VVVEGIGPESTPVSKSLVVRFQLLVFAPAQAAHTRQVVVRGEPIPKDERGRVSAVSKLETTTSGDRGRHTALTGNIKLSEPSNHHAYRSLPNIPAFSRSLFKKNAAVHRHGRGGSLRW